jgi:hypothetical protein
MTPGLKIKKAIIRLTVHQTPNFFTKPGELSLNNRIVRLSLLAQLLLAAVAVTASVRAIAQLPNPVVLAKGWQLQNVSKAPQPGAEIASARFNTRGWFSATVPGTVLTTLVNNHLYPEPLYGENNRPEVIPESLARTSWWYRTVIAIPGSYAHHRVWLNFEGINYSATVWVNGVQVGAIRGAFIRGIFDISEQVKPGTNAVVAVLVSPQPHPGVSHEHTLREGVGPNGGESAIDGPTFLSTMGWDWLPAMRDRDTGIWQKVFLSVTGPVRVKDPLVTTDLPLPNTDSSDIAVKATVENVGSEEVSGTISGTIENIQFQRHVTLAPHSEQQVSFTAKDTPVLHMLHPRLWWPNGYGAQNLYQLHLSFSAGADISDARDVSFGVRKITYMVPGTDTLTISVNGVPVFIRGGDWGLDEAMKRIPRDRLEAEIRLHKLANLNLIRNWVGQSTSEDFYELCDKYGILVWDEFFQPNPGDGPNPTDIATYIANVRDKILRFRNHPSIMLWCARNEGYPPPEIDADLRKLMAELEPTRRYQPSSTDGAGVRSHGPYSWRAPREFYTVTDDFFKTETGSVSIPTLESIHGMMPWKDWEVINDDWAEHDLVKGNSGGSEYPGILAARYGNFANLADFVRKAQLANYEAFRAMYEGRNAQMFHPTTAIIAWMSNPAQPSFVWQIYAYDLDPMSSYFAVMHASEPVHIQFNEATGQLQVVNNRPSAITGAVARVSIYSLDGALASQHEVKVTAAPEAATNLGLVEFPAAPAPIYFLRLELLDAAGKTISENFYWRGQPQQLGNPVTPRKMRMDTVDALPQQPGNLVTPAKRPMNSIEALPEGPDDLTALDNMPMVTLQVQLQRSVVDGKCTVIVTLRNTSPHIALMAHLQLRRRQSGERVLPAYASDNYVSLVPKQTKTITIEAAQSDLHGEDALVVVDGWNVSVTPVSFPGAAIAPNVEVQPDHWPTSGLPYETVGLR